MACIVVMMIKSTEIMDCKGAAQQGNHYSMLVETPKGRIT